jgi:PST family polysaccharide transporter
MKIDQVMLGEMAGDEAVGIYAAATRVSELWYFIPVSIVSSLFPAILRTREVDESLYYRRLQRLFSLMAALAIGIAIPMTFLSGRVVVLLFGDGFAAAGPVLALHIWAALFVFFGVAQGAWDLAENLTKLALVRVLCGALLNIALNALWIPTHGPMGAAAATVVSYGFASVLLNAIHPRTRGILTCQFHAVTRFRYLLSA